MGEFRANTRADWYGAPAQMFCAPKSKVPKAPRWNYGPWCAPSGGWGHVEPFPDDVDLDTYFNYVNSGGTCKDYAGKRAAAEGRDALFPQIDFCTNPNSICEEGAPPELKWIAGFFYWLNAVQTYSSTAGDYGDAAPYNYIDELKAWVDGGMN